MELEVNDSVHPSIQLEALKKLVHELQEEVNKNHVTHSIAIINLNNKQEELSLNQEAFNNKKKIKITEPQQILLAHYLGLLQSITQLPIQEQKKVKLISDLLKTGTENTEKYLRKIGVKGSRTYNEKNYEFLVDYFGEIGLKEQKKNCYEVLLKIRGEIED